MTLSAEPRIKACCLTAGLNRLDVDLRLSQEIPGVPGGPRDLSGPWGCSFVVVPSTGQPADNPGRMPPALPHPPSPAGGQGPRPEPQDLDRRAPSSTERPTPSQLPPRPQEGEPRNPRGCLSLSPLSPCGVTSVCQERRQGSPRLLQAQLPHLGPGEACSHLWGGQPCLADAGSPVWGKQREDIITGPCPERGRRRGAVRKWRVTCSTHRKRASS